MRRQAEAGIDVVDDGEMGKSTWITYLYERVSGLEPRMMPLEGGNILPPSRDRQAFPEFYAEHDAAFAREVGTRSGSRTPRSARPADDRGRGHGSGPAPGRSTYDPAALERDIARLKSALDRAST